MKVKIVLSYDGSEFLGFAVQKGQVRTVSNKLYEVFRSVGIQEKFNASGRTDKGVHATCQVLDIELPKFWQDLDKLKLELNKKLFPSIMIKSIEWCKDSFHARFSAKRRVYRYVVSTKEPNPFESRYVTFVKDLDEKVVSDVIKLFEGKHDFKNFKKEHGDSKTSVRVMYKTRFYRYKDYYIFYFEANGFLRSQIRMIVGFLLKLSSGKVSKKQLIEQLDGDKVYSRTLALPNGLYLAKVKY